MRSAHLWLLAGTASLGLHAALGLVLLIAVQPDPDPAPQTPAETRIEIVAHPVERTEAAPATPITESADEAPRQGPAAGTAAIPVTRTGPAPLPGAAAEAATTAGQRLTPAPPPSEPMAPAAATGGTLAPAATGGMLVQAALAATAPARPAPLAGTALAPQPPAPAAPSPGLPLPAPPPAPATAVLPVEPAPPVPPPADPAQPAQVAGPALASQPPVLAAPSPGLPLPAPPPAPAAAALPAEPAPPVPPPADPVAGPAPPATDRLAGARPAAAPGPALALPAEAPAPRPPAELAAGVPSLAPAPERVTAALAWSGGAEAQVDPLSLAAIQSFMQPGDLAVSSASAGTVRDAIGALLASVPCARLQTVFLPETGHLELRGHIPEPELRAPVVAALHRQLGGAIPLVDNMLVLPRPQCGALAAIEAVGLPQSTDQLVNPRVVGPDAHARVYRFHDGERLVFELTGPDYPAYVHVDYFDAEGGVIHLEPNETVPLRRVGAAEGFRIGADPGGGRPWISMTVAPPFGQEIVVAFAATRPLTTGQPPLREPAGPYLERLRAAVTEARRQDPGFKGEWVYFFVETRAR